MDSSLQMILGGQFYWRANKLVYQSPPKTRHGRDCERMPLTSVSDLSVLTDRSDWFRSSLGKKYHGHCTLPSEMVRSSEKENGMYVSANNTL